MLQGSTSYPLEKDVEGKWFYAKWLGGQCEVRRRCDYGGDGWGGGDAGDCVGLLLREGTAQKPEIPLAPSADHRWWEGASVRLRTIAREDSTLVLQRLRGSSWGKEFHAARTPMAAACLCYALSLETLFMLRRRTDDSLAVPLLPPHSHGLVDGSGGGARAVNHGPRLPPDGGGGGVGGALAALQTKEDDEDQAPHRPALAVAALWAEDIAGELDMPLTLQRLEILGASENNAHGRSGAATPSTGQDFQAHEEGEKREEKAEDRAANPFTTLAPGPTLAHPESADQKDGDDGGGASACCSLCRCSLRLPTSREEAKKCQRNDL